jgi:hypothetical protein
MKMFNKKLLLVPFLLMLTIWFCIVFFSSCREQVVDIKSVCSPCGISNDPGATDVEFSVWKWRKSWKKSSYNYFVVGSKTKLSGKFKFEKQTTTLLSGSMNEIFCPVIAEINSGELLVAWMERKQAEDKLNVVCRFYNKDFEPVSKFLLLGDPSFYVNHSYLQSCFIANHNAVLIWESVDATGKPVMSLQVINTADHVADQIKYYGEWGAIRNPQICNSGMGYTVSFISESSRPMIAFFNRFHNYQGCLDVASDIPGQQNFSNIDIAYDHAINKYLVFFGAGSGNINYRWVGNGWDLGAVNELEPPCAVDNAYPFQLVCQQSSLNARYVLAFHGKEKDYDKEALNGLFTFPINREVNRSLTPGKVQKVASDRDSTTVLSSTIYPACNGFVILESEAKITPTVDEGELIGTLQRITME